MPRRRLDRELVSRGLARSRGQAQALIFAGRVRVAGSIVRKPAELVDPSIPIEADGDPYVSRAAHKLLGALADLPIVVAGRALDAGASTGGFTQVLLERGATEVIAVDVGTDQLHPLLRTDPRVRVWEQTNLRQLTLAHVAQRPVDLVVADVSFISVTMLLEPLVRVTAAEGSLLVMVKPQFEVGRTLLGKGGVVRSPAQQRQAVEAVLDRAAALGWYPQAAAPSRLSGPAGNREFFVWLRADLPGAQVDLDALVAPGSISGTQGGGAYAVPVTESEDPVRRVGVLTHMGRPAAIAAANRLVEGLGAAGVMSALPAADVACLDAALTHFVSPLSDPVTGGGGIELMVVLGGDGSILRGAEWVFPHDIPLLGVNLGHVGFLAEAESSEIDSIVAHVVDRSYFVEERFAVEVVLRDCATEEVIWSSYAINEVSIEKAARERMLEVLVEVDGRPLSRWACDGVLVATPTGSTAYAFSAGGPVIWPGVNALLVVPLSAHALFARPLVLGPDSRVVIEVVASSPTHGVVWCDGRRATELRAGMEIEVHEGPHRLRLARLSRAPFTDRLVNKFGLRVEGWRGSAEAAEGAQPQRTAWAG